MLLLAHAYLNGWSLARSLSLVAPLLHYFVALPLLLPLPLPLALNLVLHVHRLTSLSVPQEAALGSLVGLLDEHFLRTGSHEKRCVALHLACRLVTLCPAETLPLALSQV